MTYIPMTKERWLKTVADNHDALRRLVSNYHPSARRPDAPWMPITAPSAEQACQVVRQKIRKERPDDPLEGWDHAYAAGDIRSLYSLLSDAWFGVPESTEWRWCRWSIPGFCVACDLMDDIPEDDEEEAEPCELSCISCCMSCYCGSGADSSAVGSG